MRTSVAFFVYAVASTTAAIASPLSSTFAVRSNDITYSSKGSNVSYPTSLGGVNLLSATAYEVAQGLENGVFTSAELVTAYLQRIAANDVEGLKLNSLLDVAPEDNVLAIAKKLDAERAAGKSRSPLHGLAIAVKDNYDTDVSLGMNTTAGSYALQDQKVKGDAFVIKKLRDAGVIILAKSNLNEFAGEMGRNNPSAFSAVGGLTSSAYVPGGFAAGGDPGGSSGGSAVATSAGFVSFALGTDTEGSISDPSNKAGLYAMRPSTGRTSRTGVVPISQSQDTTGPIAKGAWDVAAALQIMAGLDPEDDYTKPAEYSRQEDYLQYVSKTGLKGLRVGVPRSSYWNSTYNGMPEAFLKQHEYAIEVARKAGAIIVDNVEFNNATALNYAFPAGALPINSATTIILTDTKADMAHYLQTQRVNSSITTLADIINFNDANPILEAFDTERTGQKSFVGAQAMPDRQSSRNYWASKYDIESLYTQELVPAYEKYNLDVLVIPAEGGLPRPGVIGRMPVGTVPVGIREDGRAFGVGFVGKRFDEGTVIKAMSGYEAAFGERPLPPTLD